MNDAIILDTTSQAAGASADFTGTIVPRGDTFHIISIRTAKDCIIQGEFEGVKITAQGDGILVTAGQDEEKFLPVPLSVKGGTAYTLSVYAVETFGAQDKVCLMGWWE